MNTLAMQLEKARKSKFRLWCLNQALWKMVPFNNPHKLRIVDIDTDVITVMAKHHLRQNRNHIRGMHACLLATLCEYVSGLSLLAKLSPARYRLILQKLEMTYFYQAKTDVLAAFRLTDEQVQSEITGPLGETGAVVYKCAVEVYDLHEHLIAAARVHWQLKNWEKVRTKI